MSSTARRSHEKYFEILEDYFGLHYKKMKKHGQTALEASHEAQKSYSPALADSVCDTLFEELAGLDWNSIENWIRRQSGVKALFEYPVESLAYGKPVQRLSLYADTIVFSGTHLQRHKYGLMNSYQRLTAMIAPSLLLLEMKDLFFADVTPPIAVVIRPVAFSHFETRKTWEELRELDGLEMCSNIFGQKFSSQDEIRKFLLRHKTLNDLCEAVKNPKLITFNGVSLKETIEEMLKWYARATSRRYTGWNDHKVLASEFITNLFGNSGLMNSQLYNCGSLEAEPVAANLFRWSHLMWKFKHDNEFFAEKLGLRVIPKDSLVLNMLQLDNFKWLGNIPLNGIVRMREEGELRNLREILSEGVKEIETVSDEDFGEVTKQVSYNLNQAFKQHKTQVKRLDEKYRRKYDIDVATLVVGGSIGMMSALFPPLTMAIGVLGGFVGGGSIMKIIQHILEERSERIELQRKPIGLLFGAYQDRHAKP